MKKTAELIPESLRKYFPKCARAGEGMRVELISLGSSYAFGSNGYEQNSKYALWAFMLAVFEDDAYYTEIGKEPLSYAASNYRGIQMHLFFESLPFFKRIYYRKLAGWMYKYLETMYFN